MAHNSASHFYVECQITITVFDTEHSVYLEVSVFSLSEHPKAAIHEHLKSGHTFRRNVQDIDSSGRVSSLSQHGECLEGREETTNHRLGTTGWSLRKIQETTRVRRETISAYLRGASVEIWPPGRWKREGKAKPAIEV